MLLIFVLSSLVACALSTDTTVLWVQPTMMNNEELVVNIWWDHTAPYFGNLDNVMMIPNGCVVSFRGGACLFDNGVGAASIGGISCVITRSDNNQYTNSLSIDSSASYATASLRGAESIYLVTPDTGLYSHLVYNYGVPGGSDYTRSNSARVEVYTKNTGDNGPNIVYSLAQSSTTCRGRFWNTFRMTISAIAPISANFTTVNSFSATPSIALGTTDAQAFEYVVFGSPSRPVC